MLHYLAMLHRYRLCPMVIMIMHIYKMLISTMSALRIHSNTKTILSIGRFSEAGLHEWMPFIIFRARSCERSQLSLSGWFLSRRCFTLCLTMEVEPTTAKHHKCYQCCSCKKLLGKGDGGWNKVSLLRFLADRRSRVLGKNVVLGILLHKQQVIVCCQTHSNYGPSKMPLKLAV